MTLVVLAVIVLVVGLVLWLAVPDPRAHTIGMILVIVAAAILLILLVVAVLDNADAGDGHRGFLVGGPTVLLARLAEWRRRTRVRRATIIGSL
jgi:hypothetical protein